MFRKILEKIGFKRSEEGFFEGVSGAISYSSIESGGVFRKRFEYFVKDPGHVYGDNEPDIIHRRPRIPCLRR